MANPDAALLLERLRASIARVNGSTSNVKAVIRDDDGRIVGLAERKTPDMAGLADGMAQIEALTPLIPDMSQRQAEEYAVAMIALTEAGERHSEPPLRTQLRTMGDSVRDMLREKGITLDPWYS